jgi:hypothetical protein
MNARPKNKRSPCSVPTLALAATDADEADDEDDDEELGGPGSITIAGHKG